jgi:hypothetical protein
MWPTRKKTANKIGDNLTLCLQISTRLPTITFIHTQTLTIHKYVNLQPSNSFIYSLFQKNTPYPHLSTVGMYKRTVGPFKEASAEEKKYHQGQLEETHAAFVAWITR